MRDSHRQVRGDENKEGRSRQGHKEGECSALECSVMCAPFRMGMTPKPIEWGENVGEESHDHKSRTIQFP